MAVKIYNIIKNKAIGRRRHNKKLQKPTLMSNGTVNKNERSDALSCRVTDIGEKDGGASAPIVESADGGIIYG